MNKLSTIVITFLLILTVSARAQSVIDTTATVAPIEKNQKVKKRYNFGVLPAVGYNSDVGFRYGILGNIYDYGDGSSYPNYEQSLYMEWSRTTKGNGTNCIIFDTRKLIPNTKMIADVNYTTERALDFFGFNGYQAYYNPDFTTTSHEDYISRMYYAHARKVLRATVDFQGISETKGLNWLAGVGFFGTQVSTVDVAKLNEGKKENLLPENVDLLYDKYVNWGVIPEKEAYGGNVLYLKGGAVYDTRDKETNPSHGLWSEASLMGATGVGNTKATYLRALISHRQYIPVVEKKLTFAYRLSYQTTLLGETPFYMCSNMMVRGVLRNRIVGEGVAFANLELRSRLVDFTLINQNFYIGLIGFLDSGMVTKPYKFNETNIPSNEVFTVKYAPEKPHLSAGAGLRIAMNENFVVAVDYGKAFNKQDGNSGFYIGLGYLF